MAILSQLEYRFNLFTDAVLQPFLTGVIEVTLWSAILASTATGTLAGFPKSSYLAYALWAAFFSRISANWMYEYRMMEEIESGSVNSVLSRPISFYEYYLGQFMGYKLITTVISFLIPIAIVCVIPGPTQLSRLPLSCLLVFFYLIFVHTLSFSLASFGFFFNRVNSLTVAKNIALWVLTGELFPLDLVPEPFRHILIALPFSSAVYVPVGYLTGRFDSGLVWQGLASVVIGTGIVGVFAYSIWTLGRNRYSGTGA
jgi:ABC-2 type transport system permease protein